MVSEIAPGIGISYGRAQVVTTDDYGNRKASPRQVPRLLTDEQ